MILLASLWLALAPPTFAAPALLEYHGTYGDWRHSMVNFFNTHQTFKSPALTALRPLWLSAPTLGAQFAVERSLPMILRLQGSLEALDRPFEADTFSRLEPQAQLRLMENAAEQTARDLRLELKNAVGEQALPMVTEADVLRRKGLLHDLERMEVFFTPQEQVRLREESGRLTREIARLRGQKSLEELQQISQGYNYSDLKHALDFQEKKSALSADAEREELRRHGDVVFLERRVQPLTERERGWFSALKAYSPGLDPTRASIVRDGPWRASAMSGNDWALGRVLELRLDDRLAIVEKHLIFSAHPNYDRYRLALHEGFHQGDLTYEPLASGLVKKVPGPVGHLWYQVLREGFTELRARRAYVQLLADGAVGASKIGRAAFEELLEALPNHLRKTVQADASIGPISALVDALYRNDSGSYTPFVAIVERLEALMGLWSVESIVLWGDINLFKAAFSPHWDLVNQAMLQVHQAMWGEKGAAMKGIRPGSPGRALLQWVASAVGGKPPEWPSDPRL